MSVKPIITEKSVRLAQELNKYMFSVPMSWDKLRTKSEIAHLFEVTVVSANALVRLGKTVRFGRRNRVPGKKKDQKIMVVTLKEGDTIKEFQL